MTDKPHHPPPTPPKHPPTGQPDDAPARGDAAPDAADAPDARRPRSAPPEAQRTGAEPPGDVLPAGTAAPGNVEKRGNAESVDDVAAAAAETVSAAMDEEVRRLRADLDDARDRALRFQAELDNFRKRMAREMEAERRYAAAPLLADLLGVLDNIRRAVSAGQQTAQGDSLLEGVRLVAQQLEDVLRRHHCVPIEALHAPFDPHVHEAVCQQPTDEFPPNTVVQVLREGYQLHDRVIRPSQVVVSTSPQPDNQE